MTSKSGSGTEAVPGAPMRAAGSLEMAGGGEASQSSAKRDAPPAMSPASQGQGDLGVERPPSHGSAQGPDATVDGEATSAMKKQQFVERVVEETGVARKDVKAVVEATLALIGEALSSGMELNLPPLGKLKVNRVRGEGPVREDGAPEVLILKLRRNPSSQATAATPGLAEDGDTD